MSLRLQGREGQEAREAGCRKGDCSNRNRVFLKIRVICPFGRFLSVEGLSKGHLMGVIVVRFAKPITFPVPFKYTVAGGAVPLLHLLSEIAYVIRTELNNLKIRADTLTLC